MTTCPSCHRTIPGAASGVCPHCGLPWKPSPVTRGRPIIAVLRPLLPFVALLSSFLPWVKIVAPTGVRFMDAYQLGPFAWAWLALDVGAIGMGIRAFKIEPPRWLDTAWVILGSVSLGVALSGFVFVKVAGRVSAVLGAPNPLELEYGLLFFTLATLFWTLMAWSHRWGGDLPGGSTHHERS